MKTVPNLEFPEPERYELSEPPRYRFELNRREFVQTLGAGLLLCVAIPGLDVNATESLPAPTSERLHIGNDGVITVFTSKVEVGQGSRTQLTQAAAEELGVPIHNIRMYMADTALGPDDGGTAGSRTTPSSVPAIRKGCAAAREMLIEAAAKKFGIDGKSLAVEDGKVTGLGEGREFGYSDLAKAGQSSVSGGKSGEITLRPVSEWTVLGRPAEKVDARAIVTGAHRYPSDVVLPRMLYGKIVRPPRYGAALVNVDLESAREKAPVVVRDGNFLAVAAESSYEAARARDELAKNAEWTQPEHPSSKELFDWLKSHSREGRNRGGGSGNAGDILASAANPFHAQYDIAYIQHAPMETRAAVAEWEGDRLTVWTGTQQPGRVRQELAQAFHMPQEKVRVIVPDTGGGFGGKHSGEAAVEAARLAKEAKRPVSLKWTRAEEFTWAYFRPAGVILVAGALENGEIKAWRQINYNSGGSALETPYSIANKSHEFKNCDAPLRGGSYRALASTANNFARESAMDELALAAKANPLEFRLKHLTNERLRNVLVAAAEKFNWNERRKQLAGHKSRGIGLSCGTEKGSYLGCCVEVEVAENGKYRIVKIVQAFECGAVQNPRNLKAQVEGAVIQGLGGAQREEMRFENGKIQNGRFSQYFVPRFSDVPKLTTVLVDRKDLPSVGAGETPIIGVAPALANALFHATQQRIRTMPIRGNGLEAA